MDNIYTDATCEPPGVTIDPRLEPQLVQRRGEALDPAGKFDRV